MMAREGMLQTQLIVAMNALLVEPLSSILEILKCCSSCVLILLAYDTSVTFPDFAPRVTVSRKLPVKKNTTELQVKLRYIC